ncbi:hypothetical protein Tco_0961720 [Tanacetum coccineum]
MKAEALKEQTTASRPSKSVDDVSSKYTCKLVPRVLPTKICVKINIFALIQLFSDLEKNLLKAIDTNGVTKGEKGFEQTKNVILIETIFEELEAEFDKNVMNRESHDEIE